MSKNTINIPTGPAFEGVDVCNIKANITVARTILTLITRPNMYSTIPSREPE